MPVVNWWTGLIWRPSFDSIRVDQEPPASSTPATQLLLTASDSVINEGDSISLSATLTDTAVGLAAQDVIFESKEFGGSTWDLIETVVTNGSGVAVTATFIPTTSASYRARFVTTGSYLGVISATKNVSMQGLSTITKRYIATWGQTYKVDDSQDGSDNYLYHGKPGSSRGSLNVFKALIGFDNDRIQFDLAGITASLGVKVSLKAKDTATGGIFDLADIALGSHDYDTKPTNWSSSRVDADTNRSALAANTRTTVSCDTGELADALKWQDGSVKGVAIGPPPGANAYIYYAKIFGIGGFNEGDKPWIELTYTKWQ